MEDRCFPSDLVRQGHSNESLLVGLTADGDSNQASSVSIVWSIVQQT